MFWHPFPRSFSDLQSKRRSIRGMWIVGGSKIWKFSTLSSEVSKLSNVFDCSSSFLMSFFKKKRKLCKWNLKKSWGLLKIAEVWISIMIVSIYSFWWYKNCRRVINVYSFCWSVYTKNIKMITRILHFKNYSWLTLAFSNHFLLVVKTCRY